MPHETIVPLQDEAGEYAYAKLAATVAREFARALAEEKQFDPGLTRVELARRMGVDKAFISRALNGSGNLTLRSVAAIFQALGYEAELTKHRIAAPPTVRTNHVSPPRDMAAVPPRTSTTASVTKPKQFVSSGMALAQVV